MDIPRPVRRVLTASRIVDGALVRQRALPTTTVRDIDPIAGLEELGPRDLAPGDAERARPEPRRGLLRLTTVVAGELAQRDSSRGPAPIAPTTIAAGDVHVLEPGGLGLVEELGPSERLIDRGGPLHAFSVYLQLTRPAAGAAAAAVPPRAHHVRAADVPAFDLDDRRVHLRLLAGVLFGIRSPLEVRLPFIVAHLRLAPGARVSLPVDRRFVALLYLSDGLITPLGAPSARRAVRARQLVHFEHEGDSVQIEVPNVVGDDVRAEGLFVAGLPLREPLARAVDVEPESDYLGVGAPSNEEVKRTLVAFREGRLGHLDPIDPIDPIARIDPKPDR
jgi:hypothetical protein